MRLFINFVLIAAFVLPTQASLAQESPAACDESQKTTYEKTPFQLAQEIADANLEQQPDYPMSDDNIQEVADGIRKNREEARHKNGDFCEYPEEEGEQYNLENEYSKIDPVKNYPLYFKRSIKHTEDKDRDSFISDKEYWKDYVSDAKDLVKAPLNWSKYDWMKVSAVVAGTVGLMFADKSIQNYIHRNKSGTTQKVSDVFEFVGNPAVYLPAVAMTYLYGKYTDDTRLRRAALLSFRALMLAQLTNVPLKYLTGRKRPRADGTRDQWDFRGPEPTLNWGLPAFASGHSASLFAVATTFSMEYQDKPWLQVVLYAAAALASLSRVHDDHHWTSDVFLGAAIGTGVGYLVYKNSKKKRKKGESERSFMLIPEVGSRYNGARIDVIW